MTDLTEIFDRNLLTPNAEWQVGYTAAELEQIIAYYKAVMAKRCHFKKDGTPQKKRTRKAKADARQIDLEDLIDDDQTPNGPPVVRKIAP
jgi:dipeptide/tripeptide permease